MDADIYRKERKGHKGKHSTFNAQPTDNRERHEIREFSRIEFFYPRRQLPWIENVFLPHAFDFGHGAENGIQCADTQRAMIGNGQAMVTRGVCFQNHVAAFLMNPAVAMIFAEQFNQLRTAQITGEFHAPVRSSSRTKCSRTAAGLGWSKKYADTASRTLARNSSQVLPWVKMSCDRHSAA